MHGGAWEWTDSRSGRGGSAQDRGKNGAGRLIGVTRGGNGKEGELLSRCANARALGAGDRLPSVGFRCCAGPRNEIEVTLDVKGGPAFERTAHATAPSPPLDALEGTACGPPSSPAPCSISRAWTWRPVPNVELALAGGCVGRDPTARCALALSRGRGGPQGHARQIDTGREIPESCWSRGWTARIRVRGADVHGPFFRELVFDYGRVAVKDVH